MLSQTFQAFPKNLEQVFIHFKRKTSCETNLLLLCLDKNEKLINCLLSQDTPEGVNFISFNKSPSTSPQFTDNTDIFVDLKRICDQTNICHLILAVEFKEKLPLNRAQDFRISIHSFQEEPLFLYYFDFKKPKYPFPDRYLLIDIFKKEEDWFITTMQ